MVAHAISYVVAHVFLDDSLNVTGGCTCDVSLGSTFEYILKGSTRFHQVGHRLHGVVEMLRLRCHVVVQGSTQVAQC